MEENQNITSNENETTNEKLVLWETYSYKQIAELLGEKPSGGKKRMLQFARWKKRYDLEPVKGKKYQVTKIRYNVPVAQPPTIDERRTFQNYIYYILLCYMQFQSGSPFNKSSKYTMCFISKKEVQQITGFTNELFLLEGNYDKREEFKENYPSISKEILTEAYEDGYHTIRNTLVSLRRRNMINYAEEIQISTCDMPYAWRTATYIEIDRLRQTKLDTLTELGYNPYQICYLSKEERKAYYELLKKKRKKYNIEAARNTFCLWLPKDEVARNIREFVQSNQTALNGLDDCVKKLNERTVDKLRRKTKENLIRKKELNLREKKNLSTVYDWWKFINELGITQLSYIDVKQNWYDTVEAFNLDYIDLREEGIDTLIKIQKTNKSESQCLYKISYKNKFIDSDIINIVDNITEASEAENVIVDFRQDESDDGSTDRELTIDDWEI